MTTASLSEISKATRGTKRVCQACEVRFYDLSRDPIVCPACGAQYALAAMPVVEPGARKAPYTAKKGWGDRTETKRPEPVREEAESKVTAESASQELEDENETVPDVEAAEEDDTVLEPEVDEPDVTGLVDHVDEPKEP